MAKDAIWFSNWLGYLTNAEVGYLKELCKGLPGERPDIINIGAGAGTSGLAIAEARPGARRFTVDISNGGPLGGLTSERNAFREAEMYDLLPLHVLGDSARNGERWTYQVDLVFIDADHHQEAVERDILAWLPKIKPGGVIAFHDYGAEKWPGVAKACDRLLKGKAKAIGLVDTIKAYRVSEPKKPRRKASRKEGDPL